MTDDTYWRLLLEGSHLDAPRRARQRRGKRDNVPARVQELIDRIRLEQGIPPVYASKDIA